MKNDLEQIEKKAERKAKQRAKKKKPKMKVSGKSVFQIQKMLKKSKSKP
mgnify:FL=1|jgi:hypothetical protein|tara:strand:- start:11543 stop:11689 length:147 start_codon:yes stop_codon:yes gene_type:complete